MTFGAPPCLTEPEHYGVGDPPVINVIRPNDIVPCLSLDLIGLPFKPITIKPPATPYHYGEHFMLRRQGRDATLEGCVLKRWAVLGSSALQCGAVWSGSIRCSGLLSVT